MTDLVQSVTIDDAGWQAGSARIQAANKATVASTGEVIAASEQLAQQSQKIATGVGVMTDTQRNLVTGLTGSARAYDSLRRSIDPAYDATVRLQKAQRDADAAVRAGRDTQAGAAATIEAYRQKLTGSIDTTNQHANSMKLNAFQAQNLSFQLNDVAVSLVSGQNPFRVAIQQGSQITPIFGGLANTAKLAAGAIFSGPGALVAGVVALGAILVTGVTRAVDMAAQVRALDVRLTALGNTTAGTALQFRNLARDLSLSGVSTSDATATVEKLIKAYPFVSTAQVSGLSKLSTDIGAGLGISSADAAQKLVDAFTKGLPSIKAFDDEVHFLTSAEREQITTLAEHGKGAEALGIAIGKLHDRFDGELNKSLSDSQRALLDFKRSWDDLLESFGNSGAITTALTNLANAAQVFSKLVRGDFSGIAGDVSAQIAADKAKLFGPQPAAAPQQDLAAIIDAQTKAGNLGLVAILKRQQAAVAPSVSAADIANVTGALAPSPAAAAGLDDEAKKVDALKSKLNDLTRADLQQVQALGAEANQREIVRARLAAQLEAANQNLQGAAAEEFVRRKVAVVIGQQSAAVRDQTAALLLNLKATRDVTAAYEQSAAAGLKADAQRQAQLEHLQNANVNVPARTQQLLQQGSSAASLALAQQIPGLRAANDNLSRLAAANGDPAALAAAGIANQVSAQQLDAINKAAAAGDEAELARLKQEATLLTGIYQTRDDINKQITLAAATRTEQDNLEIAKTELQYIGQSDEVRQKAIDHEKALLYLKQQNEPLDSQAAKDYLAAADALGQVQGKITEIKRQQELWLEPLKNAISGIQSAFANLFQGIFSGGISTFSDFASAVKQIFITLAAQIAALLVFRPVVGSILGSIGLTGIASQLGFTSATGGLGGVSGGATGGIGGIGSLLGFAGTGASLLGGSSGFSLSGLLGLGGGVTAAGGLEPIGGLSGNALAELQNMGIGTLGQQAGSGSALSGFGNSISGLFGGGTTSAGSGLFSGFGGGLGAGLGAVGGIYGLYQASQTQSHLGGAIGGALSGAALGTAIFPGIGTAIGAIGGALFGGLLGGKPSVGPNGTVGIFPSGMSATSRMTSGDNGFSGGGILDYGSQAAAALSALAQAYGVPLTDAARGQFRQGKGGIDFQTAGSNGSFMAGGSNPVATYVQTVIQQGALQGISQVDPQVLADALSGQADDAIALVKQQQEQAQRLAAEQALAPQIQDQINALQQLADAYGNATDAIQGAIDSLKVGNLSPLTPAEQLATARGQFAGLVNRAQAGDLSALSAAPQAAQTVLQLSRSYSPAGYPNDFAAITGTLGDLKASAAANQAKYNGDVAAAMASLAAINQAGFNGTIAQLAQLQASFDSLAADLRIANQARRAA